MLVVVLSSTIFVLVHVASVLMAEVQVVVFVAVVLCGSASVYQRTTCMHIKQNNSATPPTTIMNERNTFSIGSSHGSSSAAPPPHNQCTTNDRDRDGCMLAGSGIILQSVFEMLIGKLLKNDWKESWRDWKVTLRLSESDE